jgi:tetratricopeptide (TPR) repeat protein
LHYSRLAGRYLRGEPERAEAIYHRALDLYERVARTHPDRVVDWIWIYYPATRYGHLLRGQGREAEAGRLDRRILGLFERPEVNLDWFARAGEQPAFGFIFLSELLVRCGQPLRAVQILERARPHIIYSGQYGEYSLALTNLCLVLAADADPAVVARVVALAREGVESTTKSDAQAWLLLGLALERAGDRPGAEDAVRRGIELSGDGGDCLDWFVLAIVHRRLGHDQEARVWYDKAVAWMAKNRPQNPGLTRIRAEAAALLGTSTRSPDAKGGRPDGGAEPK